MNNDLDYKKRELTLALLEFVKAGAPAIDITIAVTALCRALIKEREIEILKKAEHVHDWQYDYGCRRCALCDLVELSWR